MFRYILSFFLFLSLPLSSENKKTNDLKDSLLFTQAVYTAIKDKDHNFVISPFSLRLALAMAAEAANGDTKEELLEAGFWDKYSSERHKKIETLLKALKTGIAAGGEPVHILLANQLWYSDALIISPQLETTLQTYFDAQSTPLDFLNDAEGSRKKINDAILEATQDNIKDLLPQGSINRGTQLVLAQALYFSAPWRVPFFEEDTFSAPFYGLEKSLRPIPYIQKVDHLKVLERKKYSVVEVPFVESKSASADIKMLVVLPKEEFLLSEVENKIYFPELFKRFYNYAKVHNVHLVLPKFSIEKTTDFKQIFWDMGMKIPFDPDLADFGLDEKQKAAITSIYHGALFEIDENGGKGAAATAIGIGTTAYEEPVEFVVNRPFIFFVYDEHTGEMLFTGRVMQPKFSK